MNELDCSRLDIAVLQAAREVAAEDAPHGLVTLTGTYEVTLTTRFANAQLLQNALPDGLELRPADGVPQGHHPLILMFGFQHDVVTSVLGSGFKLNYGEGVIGIPSVGLTGDASGHVAMFMPRLDVSDLAATVMGWFVGYQKVLSVINAGPRRFLVREFLKKAEIYELGFTPTGQPGDPYALPNFRFTMNQLRQPLVSVNGFGEFVFTVFRWRFDQCQLQGVSASLAVAAGLPALPHAKYSWDSYATVIQGAGHLVVPWTLTGPFSTWPPDSGDYRR